MFGQKLPNLSIALNVRHFSSPASETVQLTDWLDISKNSVRR
jgi:hypothetical protein